MSAGNVTGQFLMLGGFLRNMCIFLSLSANSAPWIATW